MLRKTLRATGVVAVSATLVMGLGGTAPANEPVGAVVETVARAADTDVKIEDDVALPRNIGGGDTGGGTVRAVTVQSAVVGYITIVRGGLPGAPTTTWTAAGALADPNQWACSGAGGTTAYTVSCTPVVLPVNVNYTCQVLHADVAATTIGASGRTSMDCNSDGVPEAQTPQKFGPAGYDFVWATSNMAVTAFTCTLDMAVPSVRAGCGDPGTVGVE